MDEPSLVHRLRNPHGHSQVVMRLEAADRIEALEAQCERLEGKGWHPIETAPKVDCANLLLFDPDYGVCMGWWIGGYDGEPDTWEVTDGCSSSFGEPTHWMPLPTPPG